MFNSILSIDRQKYAGNIIKLAINAFNVLTLAAISLAVHGNPGEEDMVQIRLYCEQIHEGVTYDQESDLKKAIDDCIAEESRYYGQYTDYSTNQAD